MHGVLQSLLGLPIRIKMEDVTVHDVLEKSPEDDSSHKQPCGGHQIRSQAQALVKGQCTVRDENSQHRAGADMAQPLEQRVFKHDQFPATRLKMLWNGSFSAHDEVMVR